MENENDGEKGIEMNVEGVAPFDVVTTTGRGGYQIFVSDEPKYGSHDHSRGHGIDENDPQYQFNAGANPEVRPERKEDGGQHKKEAQEDEKGGIVPRPLVFGPFSMLKVKVNFLGGDAEMNELPNGELKVHLAKHENSPQIFVSLLRGGSFLWRTSFTVENWQIADGRTHQRRRRRRMGKRPHSKCLVFSVVVVVVVVVVVAAVQSL